MKNWMEAEMNEAFKNDILSGRIKSIRLVDTPNPGLRANRDALIFNTYNPIVKTEDDKFLVRIRRCLNGVPVNEYDLAEAYYSAFSFYDADLGVAKTQVDIPSAVSLMDSVKTDIFEVAYGWY